MYCRNCGTNLSVNDKFCQNCGTLINSTEIQDNKNINGATSYLENNNQATQRDFNEEFIKAYIGVKADKMYESIKKGGINLWSMIFGLGYFFYRKMYLVSVLIIVIETIIGFIIPSIVRYVGLAIGLLFCPLYKWDITRKLRKIKNENPTATENQLLEIAKNKGGTSIVGAILFFVIIFILMFILILMGA